MSCQIVIDNERITDFYNKNPHINIETVNLMFIDILENVTNKMDEKCLNNINNEILENVSYIKTMVSTVKDDIFGKMNVLLNDLKSDYIMNVKQLFNESLSINNDSVIKNLSGLNDSLIDKTKITLSEILPQNNTSLLDTFTLRMTLLHKSLQEDFEKINTKDDTTMQNILSNFESKFNSLLINVTNASESRINETINNEKNSNENLKQEILKTMNNISDGIKEHNDFFEKHKNSSHKGNLSETYLENILSTLYQSGEIINSSKETACGDFILKRKDYSPILFENKDYSRNVPLDEVKKFIRDTDTQKCHGIFLSQHSGITSKQNFEIETKGYNVLIYIHNVEYCSQTIKTAVDIIDSLSDKIEDLKTDDENDFVIPKDILEDINKEVYNFNEKRRNILNLLKDFNGKMEKELQQLDFTSLSKYVSSKLGVISNEDPVIICDICNTFKAHSNKSLAAHKRKCSKTISYK